MIYLREGTVCMFIKAVIIICFCFDFFNKIATQGTPQMAVYKEAIICLSRVYSYYSKCNFPLFYVYPDIFIDNRL